MKTRSIFSRQKYCYIAFLIAASIALSGCSRIPWIGNSTKSQPQQQVTSYKPSEPLIDMRAQPAPTNTQPVAKESAPTVSAKRNFGASKPQAGYAQRFASDGKKHVAILLPLSGKNAALGQAMLNAAQMAVFDLAGDNFELMPRDTGANAGNAARDAIGSGAQLLIGPLFASDVAAVKPVVQTSSVNMLSLSSDVSLAEPGVYVMGFAPASMVKRTIDYANHRGMTRFAGIFPNDAYGKLVQKAFTDAVSGKGNSVVAIETYSSPYDTGRAVSAISAKKDQIDALFIPAGGDALKRIATQLAANGIDGTKIKLLGSGLWDEAGISENASLIGAWYAAAEPDARNSFTGNYAQTYGTEPPRLASLAYDATALAVVMTKRGENFDRKAITNPSGFAGLDGIFRFTRQGTAERGLAIKEVGTSGDKIVDPAPSTFIGM